jgi:hypothetical protein
MRMPLAICFFVWIIGGFAGLCIIVFLTWHVVCSGSEQSNYPAQTTNEKDNGGGALRHLIDNSTRRAITDSQSDQKVAAGHPTEASNTKQNPRLLAAVCEAKITDLGLVYFTYCLVIVGWFGIRSSEINVQKLERAYVFHGYGPVQSREGRVRFSLNMKNTGRSPAHINEVGYVFLDRVELPAKRSKINWNGKIVPYDWIMPSDMRRSIRKLQSPIAEHVIFVAYIKYRDLFSNQPHTTWWAAHFYPNRPPSERIARAGGDTWNEWN